MLRVRRWYPWDRRSWLGFAASPRCHLTGHWSIL